MSIYCLVLLFFYFLHSSKCGKIDVFEFGINEGGIALNLEGHIGALSKISKIPLKLPNCRKIIFVRVDVDNYYAPPVVEFDESMLTVYIKYRLLQYSKSKYNIVAKTVPIRVCNPFLGV